MTLEELREKVLRVQSDPDRWGYTYAFSHRQALALLDCAAALSAAKSELCIANCPARTHVDECTDAFNALTKLKEAGVTI